MSRSLRNLSRSLVTKVVVTLVVGIAVYVLAPRALLWTVHWVNPDDDEQRNEFIRTVLTALGASALLFQLRYTAQATRAATRTLEVTEQGQYTDRFFKAVEQLGDDRIALQLGALYSLHRIALDSPRDSYQVASIISAFVRQKAGLPTAEQRTLRGGDGYKTPEVIRVAIEILSRVNSHLDLGTRFDLSNTDLRGLEVRGGSLAYGNFRGANLSCAFFWGTDLTHVDMSGIVGDRAGFHDSPLAHADLTSADLESASFTDDQLSSQSAPMLLETWFLHSNLRGAQFRVQDLSKIYVHQEHFDEVQSLSNVRLPDGMRLVNNMYLRLQS